MSHGGQVSVCNQGKRRYKNMSDEEKKARQKQQNEWVKNNRDKINKKQRESRVGVCEIIKEHDIEHKDDPESLDIRKMMNINCD